MLRLHPGALSLMRLLYPRLRLGTLRLLGLLHLLRLMALSLCSLRGLAMLGLLRLHHFVPLRFLCLLLFMPLGLLCLRHRLMRGFVAGRGLLRAMPFCHRRMLDVPSRCGNVAVEQAGLRTIRLGMALRYIRPVVVGARHRAP